MDSGFIARIIHDGDRIFVHPDTTDGAAVSLSPRNYRISHHPPGQRSDVLSVARWAERHAVPIHKALAKTSIRWRGQDDKSQTIDWQKTERQADGFVDAVLQRLALPDMVLRADDRSAFAARRAGACNGIRHWQIESERSADLSAMTGGAILSAIVDRLLFRIRSTPAAGHGAQAPGERVVVLLAELRARLARFKPFAWSHERKLRRLQSLTRAEDSRPSDTKAAP